eukprot:TRINITY_DN64350_c0_g1_i1.p1 TRINITY_DN64350_c0_g1~~TRINITY_DN64350_c0_g1_i1.p1  ORF type:complete len:156 (-),score=18.11 TRINITY_DN64350_c0_g1_i1:122-556(-)
MALAGKVCIVSKMRLGGGSFVGQKVARPVPRCQVRAQRQLTSNISVKYIGLNADFSGIEKFGFHEKDTGCPEVQIARMTVRVKQLTAHLQEHRKDFSSRRGLMGVLNKRRRLLQYLYNNDKDRFVKIVNACQIRNPIKKDLKNY